jgi:hypothetical protein
MKCLNVKKKCCCSLLKGLTNIHFSVKMHVNNHVNMLNITILHLAMLGGIPVPTAWRVLGLRMEERPPDMEVSCEYIE